MILQMPTHGSPSSLPRQAPGPVCSGQHCHRDQQAPAAPNKGVQVPTFNDAILNTIPALRGLVVLSFSPPVETDQITGPVGRVFRPPRAA